MFIEEEVSVKKKIYVAPCIACGSEDINIFDYGYSSPNMGGGRCKSCKREVSHNIASIFPTKKELAKIWNDENDKAVLIKRAQQKIAEAQLEIERLSK